MQLNSPTWTAPSQESSTQAPLVQIWRLRLSDLDGAPLEALRPLTTTSEHRRARRYEFDADQHRHLAGRALVRLVLARRYGCAPRDLSITEGPHGKPQLDGSVGDETVPKFNVAHTDNVIVAAFGRSHPVGIDVESRTRDADLDGLAQRVFTETELQRWRALSASRRRDVFFRIWTCKEAFLKATGQGLQRAPRTVECAFTETGEVALGDADGHSPASPDTAAAHWAVRSFVASTGIVGAVVRKRDLPTSVAWIDATPLLNRRGYS
jgi:4'-phosphopantetheinyl transferase